MNNSITRERLEELAAGQSGFNLRISTLEESQQLARMALDALDTAPVGEFYEDGPLNWYQISDGDRVPAHRRIPLYRHAQPVVPPELTKDMEMEYFLRDDWKGTFRSGWDACRAAALKAGNSPAQNPGWIPVSERLPEVGGRYWCYVEEQTDLGKSHYQWNCSWNGERWWVEGEDGGIVTHWMPLPAAPQEASSESQ
ncbi:DUF551 domain-containing protein [Klebsiella oxytoca]|nr:DUF551 domain-containing protein [Klebsiella oxytoca]